MKKIVFKGVINGKQFNNEKEYTEYLTELIDSDTDISAETSTQVVDTCEEDETVHGLCECVCEGTDDTMCMDDIIFPYFNDSIYYLDKIVSGDINANSDNIEIMESLLSSNLNTLKANLHNISHDDVNRYSNKIKDILNDIQRDEKFNTDTQKSINKKFDQAVEKYKNSIDAVEKEYNNVKARYDAETEILDSAAYVMKKLSEFYEKVLKELSSTNTSPAPKTGKRKWSSGECCCNNIKTETKEVNKQTVTDLTSLINKIFGIDLRGDINTL